jgi:membrane protein DedA with SNARE-associated domain
VLGSDLWVPSMLLLGYFVGQAVPNVDAVLLALLALVILASVAPAAVHLLRERRAAARNAE